MVLGPKYKPYNTGTKNTFLVIEHLQNHEHLLLDKYQIICVMILQTEKFLELE